MKTRACFCDICGVDGEVKLAKAEYFSPEAAKHFHVCSTHLQEIKGYIAEGSDLEVTQEFETLGNVNSYLFYE